MLIRARLLVKTYMEGEGYDIIFLLRSVKAGRAVDLVCFFYTFMSVIRANNLRSPATSSRWRESSTANCRMTSKTFKLQETAKYASARICCAVSFLCLFQIVLTFTMIGRNLCDLKYVHLWGKIFTLCTEIIDLSLIIVTFMLILHDRQTLLIFAWNRSLEHIWF